MGKKETYLSSDGIIFTAELKGKKKVILTAFTSEGMLQRTITYKELHANKNTYDTNNIAKLELKN